MKFTLLSEDFWWKEELEKIAAFEKTGRISSHYYKKAYRMVN